MRSLWGRWAELESRAVAAEKEQMGLVVEFIEKHRKQFPTVVVTWEIESGGIKAEPMLILARLSKNIGFTDRAFFRIVRPAIAKAPAHAVKLDNREVRALMRNTDFVSEVASLQGRLPLTG